jgi:hypothetical protein
MAVGSRECGPMGHEAAAPPVVAGRPLISGVI